MGKDTQKEFEKIKELLCVALVLALPVSLIHLKLSVMQVELVLMFF